MSYINDHLYENEKIIYTIRLHIWHSVLYVLPFGIIALIGYQRFPEAAKYILIGIVIAFIYRLIHYLTTEIAVTNKRVVVKRGWILKNTTEFLLPKIEGVEVDKSIIDLLFDCATVKIKGTGGNSKNIKQVAKPNELRKQVHAAIEDNLKK